MTQAASQTIYLADYTPFSHVIDDVHLTFRLAPNATRVLSRIAFRPNPQAVAAPDGANSMFLHGEALTLISARIDGADVAPDLTETGLTCAVPEGAFVWEAEVEIDPASNTALEGLYMSNGMYCTQCEAEGFRKITYYPDRPDVMATFTVRIEGPEPVLLSNGNPIASGDDWAEWQDPWPKPAYLFALVAGDLRAHPDSFTTASGRDVALNIWVRPGDEGKCAFGMDALKRSMDWDERVYGREYDLDVFNIVAVDDFNMGAMENKGLNIFNSSCVLASPETSTDANFERIEAIIAHEYFHNWTGNRITCRDWFQLCLKEGLTVFRDQSFSGDMRSHAVQRINDTLALRGRQFREDNGPLAHPVRPESFVEINNFYTATVYEKGAEVIGMLKTLVGDEAYAKALDLYFDRHDGEAATIEDWLTVFQDTTGRDLSQFKRWYSQAGTPRLKVTESFDEGKLTLHFAQSTPPTPGQPDKEPMVIPIAVGLLSPAGGEIMPTRIFEMTGPEAKITYDGQGVRPIASVLRGFSAPVILERDIGTSDRAFLFAHDTDPFNKWEAGRTLAKDVILRMITKGEPASAGYITALDMVVQDDTLDPAFRALVMGLPSQDDLAQALVDSGTIPDPSAIYRARREMARAIGAGIEGTLSTLYKAMAVPGAYRPDARDAGQRALRNAALGYLSLVDGGARAQAQYDAADNMTEQLSALGNLIEAGQAEAALTAFRSQWQADRLVMDKWFGLQVAHATPTEAAATAARLTKDPDFDMKNPNRFRAVMGALSMNAAGFHDPSGAAYALLADWLIRLDPLNPQTTARMTTAFETFRRYDEDRQGMIRDQLSRIAATPNLSRDTSEMVGRILNG